MKSSRSASSGFCKLAMWLTKKRCLLSQMSGTGNARYTHGRVTIVQHCYLNLVERNQNILLVKLSWCCLNWVYGNGLAHPSTLKHNCLLCCIALWLQLKVQGSFWSMSYPCLHLVSNWSVNTSEFHFVFSAQVFLVWNCGKVMCLIWVCVSYFVCNVGSVGYNVGFTDHVGFI